jgi:hypothetical protein
MARLALIQLSKGVRLAASVVSRKHRMCLHLGVSR